MTHSSFTKRLNKLTARKLNGLKTADKKNAVIINERYSKLIETLTTKFYDLPSLNKQDKGRSSETSLESNKISIDMNMVSDYILKEDIINSLANLYQAAEIQETLSLQVCTQGGNMGWYNAIKQAKINSSLDGAQHVLEVAKNRNVSATKIRTRKVRATKKAENTLRIKKRKEHNAKKPKYQKRAPVVLPSQRV